MKPLQATVLTFDADTRTGSVVADSGTIVPFDAEAFVAGGLRQLRAGQRVQVARSETGMVEAITILTLPLPTHAEGDRT